MAKHNGAGRFPLLRDLGGEGSCDSNRRGLAVRKITKDRVRHLRIRIAEKFFFPITDQKDRLFYFWEQQTGWKYLVASSILSAILIVAVIFIAVFTILYCLLFDILEAIATVD